ncbi:hypothetical protein [Alloactinosynnema sp. L-07]|uniref:GNAT family N-acetyltransferase n=1 Tax=Alloactinosynnema sp. L-07 TaxID=1653480 RepID=UPI00065F094C|nr:GNAT family N-acetyltransferase [Alloactinosynnema sp. L-07]CRK61879.1 hypothetical protein [Alloactinosynnema sp. L-07]
MTTDVVDVADIPSAVLTARWDTVAEALLPRSAAKAAAAWHVRAVLARLGDDVVGMTMLHRSRGGTVAEIVDPTLVAPDLFPDSADFLYVGGVIDLVAGTATAVDLDPAERDAVRTALVARARQVAEESGLTPVSLYVRDAEIAAFTAGRRPAARVAGVSVIAVPGTDEEFLAGLSSNQRRTVLKDRAHTAALGLRVTTTPAAELMADRGAAAAAVELIMDVKRRHGVTEHPRLAKMRLGEWAGRPDGERVAFAVEADGEPLAVTFACALGGRLEIYETGMADVGQHKHEAYIESLVQAPLRYALAAGLTEIDLGLDAETPKTRRGAAVAPVWAVA